MITAQNWLGIDSSHIEKIDQHHGLLATAKSAFLSMQAAAQKDGIDLQLVSSFRSFDRQLAIWQAKWQGDKPLYSLHGEQLLFSTLNDQQKLDAIMTWSALPGTSRHHWGTDLDVFDKRSVESKSEPFELVSAEYEEHGPCYQLNLWLEQNAAKFDFYRPYQHYTGGVAPEPWHLSYWPSSEQIIAMVNPTDLRTQLSNIDFGGKQLVLSQLEELLNQYTLKGAIQ